MSKNSIKEKFYERKKNQTSAYLREKLFLSAERCRSILQGYEYNSELGENPKFYDEDIIKSIIDDYGNEVVVFTWSDVEIKLGNNYLSGFKYPLPETLNIQYRD